MTSRSDYGSKTIAATRQTPGPVIHRSDQHIAPPLSFAQERIWHLQQLQPEIPAFTTIVTVNLIGAIDLAALRRALNQIVCRHEIVRTTFPQRDKRPVQVIAPTMIMPLPLIDLRALAQTDRTRVLGRMVDSEHGRSFDLACGPLIRMTLIEAGDQEHTLLMSVHQIIVDDQSIGVLISELARFYTVFADGAEVPPAEPTLQYVDYAIWQHEQFQDGLLEQQLCYWRERLSGVPPLALPTDRSRPEIQTLAGARQPLDFPPPFVAALRNVSRQEGVAVSIMLLAAFVVLLHRYTEQCDIVVGMPTSGRTRSELEGMIGRFTNILVLRTDLSGNPSFRTLLQRVHELTLKAYAHEDLPFEKLEALRSGGDVGYTPLFQVLFVFQEALTTVETHGVSFSPRVIAGAISRFDLTLSICETASGLTGALEYAADLFDTATIGRMASHFQNMLDALTTNPEQRIDVLPLLSAAEREQLLVAWNVTTTAYPRELCVHELFANWAARIPDTVALVVDQDQLSYAALNRRANQLAHHLRTLGVGPDVLVGLCLDRSLELIIAILGVLKAGGAYAPLDPSYPSTRRSLLLADIHPPVLLTQQHLVAVFADTAVPLLRLDRDWSVIARQSTVDPPNASCADNLVYVMYTSGSTGTPKGVSVVHRAVVRLVQQTAFAHFDAEQVALHLAPVVFDASTLELWSALLHGARLVIVPPRTPSLAELAQTLERERVSLLWLTAGLFHQMIEYHARELSGVRQVLAGGDVLSPARVQQLLQHGRATRVINGYGPTENTTFTCCYPLDDPAHVGAAVPIGRPIANTTVYLLDTHMQPVPVGVPGELYTGGDGLARGYLGRPDLTAERFVPNPFGTGEWGLGIRNSETGARAPTQSSVLSPQSSSRLYRTGDLARYRADGNMMFLGRIDQQVKVRGFRIELGEIEAVLGQHPGVRDTVVLAHEDVPGERRLVAYVVPTNDQEPTTNDGLEHEAHGSSSVVRRPSFVGELRDFLQAQLPDYMVPAAFVVLDTLPLTPNGKVDRRALPTPDWTRSSFGTAYVVPRTPIEEILTGIWGEVLHIRLVGVYDDFFELGGHSLMGTQVLSRVRAAFQVDLPLRSIFEAPTIARLAERIEAAQRAGQELSRPPLLPADHDGVLPLSFAQQRLWFVDQLAPGNAAYNIPVAVRLEGYLDVSALAWTISEIVQRHTSLRTTFATIQGRPIQVINPVQPVTLQQLDLSNVPLAERTTTATRLVRAAAQQSFDLACGPLLYAKLLRLSPDEHIVVVTMHHIISDGWSIAVFIREVVALYEAFVTERPVLLPELLIQYADYAVWQRAWLHSETLDRQMAYWKDHLGTPPAVLDLPTDHPRPAIQTFHGATHGMSLSSALSERLTVFSQREGVTLFMPLLTAFTILLHCYSGQDDIAVGSPVAGRTQIETENLIGFFVNTMLLRIDLSGDPCLRELLGRVREEILAAHAHQDVPFEMVVEAVQPARSLSHMPLFQVMFALQNVPQQIVELPDLRLSSLEIQNDTAKCDLTLGMFERDGRINGTLEYNTDLFDSTTIARIARDLELVLEAVVTDPRQRLSALPIAPMERKVWPTTATAGRERSNVLPVVGNGAEPGTPDQNLSARRAQLLNRQTGLSADKRFLLEKRLRGALTPSQKVQTIPRASAENRTVLSFAQQRLWFLDQLIPESTLYNIPLALRLLGPLNVIMLRRALDMIVQRHEVLRTTFATRVGQPIPVISPSLPLAFTQIDMLSVPVLERAAEATRLVRAEAQRPFDLAHGPLLRISLLRLDEQEQFMVITLHHIIFDEWSTGILMHEMATLYEALVSGRPARLPELPVQYADYAVWQRASLQGEVLERHLNYWKNRLSTVSAVLELPTDHPRPASQTFHGTTRSLTLPPPLGARLIAFSQREGITLFMPLLAAFDILLHRYSGQENIAVGSPVAGRNHAELKELIGFFVNTLVIYIRLSGKMSFRELLHRVREEVLATYAHQDVPFEMVVEAVQPARSLSHMPLFQVMFVFQNVPQEAVKMSGLRLSPLDVQRDTSKFDLTLFMAEAGQQISATLEYNTDVFDDTTIARMLGHLEILLEGMMDDPDQRIGNLPLLTVTERRQLLVEWNATATVYPQDACIHALFEQQVMRTPDVVAAIYEGHSLSYHALDQRANQLAHYLHRLGVKPDTLVGLCVERSPELIIGILGILKAGGAYVPLDPTYPPARLAFLLADAQIAALVTHETLLSRLPSHTAPTVCLNAPDALAAAPPAPRVTQVQPDNLVYVIYTSGSTGRPKGVLITHGGLLNYLHWCIDRYALAAGHGSLVHSPLGFDLTVTSLLAPLCVGQPVVLLPEARAVEQLGAAVQDAQDLSLLKLTPAHLELLSQQLTGGRLAGNVRALIIGGEALTYDQLTFWRAHALATRLINEYGPTETVVGCCVYEVPVGALPTGAVPIGHPITNTQLYLLDHSMQPVPIGVAGELYIGGAGLARGYLNRPDLTAERFVPNPFVAYRETWSVGDAESEGEAAALSSVLHPPSSARLYRTGDRVRYLPDGNLTFLGRLDEQVKVRGFRIEPGEIETMLSRHSAVREAIVLIREDVPGDKRLVAYVVPNSEFGTLKLDAHDSDERSPILHSAFSFLHFSALRAFLADQLPEYMVPSAFVILEALPLTPSGKTDRRALPAPDSARSALDDAFVAPRTPLEEVLVGIWAEVLRLDRIGVHDNFFMLGGHSLLATQVIARVRDSLGVELPLRSFFEVATIAELAERITNIQRSVEGLLPPPLQPSPRHGPLPLSFAQQRLWLLNRLDPHSPAYNIPISVRLTGPLDVAAFQRGLNVILERHEAVRTTFVLIDGQPMQIVAPPAPMPLSLIDLQGLAEDEREAAAQRLAVEDSQRIFDLDRGPIISGALLRLSEEAYVMLLNMHHIAADGWSIGVFTEEMSAFYPAFVAGERPALPALPIQYTDYAVWQRGWLQGAVLETQMAYWRQQLANLPVLQLPTCAARPPVQTFRGGRQAIVLSPALSADLALFSQRAGVTLFMTLLAAWKVLLSRYSGQADIVVGSPIAGRTQAETERLIGCFINTLVLRTDLSGALTFPDVLQRVREVCLGAYAHQELPFEYLVEALQPVRDLSRHPLFQVMFTLQNTPLLGMQLPGITVRRMPIKYEVAKFDLGLSIGETVRSLTGDSTPSLTGMLDYSADLFDVAMITRLLANFQTLLEGIVAMPERSIADLPLLSVTERQQISAWNTPTRNDAQNNLCIHDLLAAQAARTPDAIALVRDDNRGLHTATYCTQYLTYTELNRRAQHLAYYLQRLEICPEMRVGICVERSLEMVVGMLSVLKAGGAYVPLDPAYPAEHRAFMLADSQATVLLTQKGLADTLPTHGVVVVELDAFWSQIERSVTTDPPIVVRPDNLAYVIYTSGSTGWPKGVAINHRSVTALLEWGCAAFTQQQIAGVLASTSICFDLSIFELFVPLSRGGTVILAENVLHLPTLRSASTVTLINTVPSAMAELMSLDDLPTAVQTVNLAGEPLPLRLVEQIYQQPNILQVVNLYGPSEDTTYSTFAVIPRKIAETPTIGRPIDNTQVYLLDPHMQPIPIGVPGELYLAGVGLARGYLNRPDLTAERFVPNPFGEGLGVGDWGLRAGSSNTQPATSSTRLYRTGDRARYLTDGRIEFLGRIDHQVKVRGFRIELGEVTATIAAHPAVHHALVVAREDTPGEKRLVAYIVPASDQRPATSEQKPGASVAPSPSAGHQSSLAADLRDFLKQKLPDFMIPSVFVELDALPLTPNGKIDRKALPAPDETRSIIQDTFVAPRDELELQLVQLWEDILDVHPIGVTDNFFELGGHSLLAVRLFSRIHTQFTKELSVATLFQDATIERLASILRQQPRPEPWSPLVPIQPAGTKRPLFWVHPAGGNVLCYSELARHLGLDQPVYGLQASGLDQRQTPHARVEDMAAYYIQALRAIQQCGPYLLGGWSVGGVLAFEMAQQLRRQGQQVGMVALLDSWAPTHGRLDAPTDDADLLALMALTMGMGRLPMPYDAFVQLEREAQAEQALEWARHAKILPPDFGQAQIRHLFEVFKSTMRALAQYQPQRYLGSITLFKASEQQHDMPHDPANGWSELVAGELKIVLVPGNHYTLITRPHVQSLAEALKLRLGTQR